MAGRAFSRDPDDEKDGGSSFNEGTTKVLEHFGRDLTALAKQGKLDPVIGREEEIDMMVSDIIDKMGSDVDPRTKLYIQNIKTILSMLMQDVESRALSGRSPIK